jgi:transposase-like protein
MTRPPFDLDIDALDGARTRRIAKSMGIKPLLDEWMKQYTQYQADADVRENSATRMRF